MSGDYLKQEAELILNSEPGKTNSSSALALLTSQSKRRYVLLTKESWLASRKDDKGERFPVIARD